MGAVEHSRAAAWTVHLYTALGLPLALFATVALCHSDERTFFLALMTACFVDATDGTLARHFRVKEVLPSFDGRKLDDIVDFLNFVFLPIAGLWRFEMIPPELAWLTAVPLMASGYGFCQERAKTDESFVGFPSYWNIVILYIALLQSGPWANLGMVLFLSFLVFVPIHYLYPTRTRLLRPVTLGLGYIWAAAMVAMTIDLYAPWTRPAAVISLVYPAYYVVLSLVNHQRIAQAPS